MIIIIVHGESLDNQASSKDEIIPLPYYKEPISAEAEPAISGT